MVDERVTDGRRVAQLLASELSGLETGPLADVAVVDADRDVEPTPEGARAYDVALGDEPTDDDRVATVTVTPQTARVEFAPEHDAVAPADRDDVHLETDDGGAVLVIESGAAVKSAVDALREMLS